MKNILLVESGAHGGGSAESLFQHIKAFEKDSNINFTIFFITKNKYLDKIDKQNKKYYTNTNNTLNYEYTQKNYFKTKFINLFTKITNKFFSKFFILYYRVIYRKLISDIKQIIIENSIDLIHTNNQPFRDLYAIIASKDMNIPVVSHVRSSHEKYINKNVISFLNENINEYIFYLYSCRDFWIKKGIRESNKIVISNALGTINIQSLNILYDYRKTNSRIISIVGKIRPERGYLFLFKVFNELVKSNYNIKLLIVGDFKGFETYYKSLVKYIKNNDLNNNIFFYGYSNQVHNIISESDALILPYYTECFGRVVLESLQLKTPVIISKSGMTEKYLTNAKNGMLFEYGNLEECKICILEMLTNKKLVNDLIKNGYRTYIDNYTLAIYRKKMSRVYDEVLK